MNTKKQIIFNDILSSHKVTGIDLKDYIYCEQDNISWLYAPLVIRSENQSLISGWSFVINKSHIQSSQVYIYGESKLTNECLSSFVSTNLLMSHSNNVEKIIHGNLNMFPDKIFENTFDEVLKKYSIEIIIQNLNYRIRIRPLYLTEISYDLFFEKNEDKLMFNIFNPEL